MKIGHPKKKNRDNKDLLNIILCHNILHFVTILIEGFFIAKQCVFLRGNFAPSDNFKRVLFKSYLHMTNAKKIPLKIFYVCHIQLHKLSVIVLIMRFL